MQILFNLLAHHNQSKISFVIFYSSEDVHKDDQNSKHHLLKINILYQSAILSKT